MVIVGPDAVAAVAVGGLPRRPGVLVVTARAPDATVWQSGVEAGAEAVLELPVGGSQITERLADSLDDRGRTGVTVAVVGGCGGAGASTLVAGLGVAASRAGVEALVVDGDPLGGGLDLALGSESVGGDRWPALVGISGRVSAQSLRMALPMVSPSSRMAALSLLSWDRGDPQAVPPDAIREVVAAGERGHDLVIVDLPRWVDPAGEQVLIKADVTLLVVPAEVRAVAAAGRVAARVRAMAAALEVVVRGPGPAGLTGAHVAEALQLPLAVEMRSDRRVASALDLGYGPWRLRRGPLAQACDVVLARQGLVREEVA
ncbi:MAG: hypothetical protein GEU93_08640 [Propionibacteriales bacterium]|nr:hypothetical protein [Propionibacteriales bacterium]